MTKKKNEAVEKPKFSFNFSFQGKKNNFEITIDENDINITQKAIMDDVMQEALSINIPTGTAEMIAEKIANKIAARAQASKDQDELDRYIAEEAEKYHEDLAYVYKNRGKII